MRKHTRCHRFPWWRHQVETFPALLAICEGNSLVTGEFPAQRPVTRSFGAFFDLRLNNGWVNNRGAGDSIRHCTHYDVTVMIKWQHMCVNNCVTLLHMYSISISLYFWQCNHDSTSSWIFHAVNSHEYVMGPIIFMYIDFPLSMQVAQYT